MRENDRVPSSSRHFSAAAEAAETEAGKSEGEGEAAAKAPESKENFALLSFSQSQGVPATCADLYRVCKPLGKVLSLTIFRAKWEQQAVLVFEDGAEGAEEVRHLYHSNFPSPDPLMVH